MKDRLTETPGASVTSSYLAASSSCKWCFGISFGRICWLMLMKKKKKRQGEQDSSYRNPCYTKKTRKCTNWKIVNEAMYKMFLTLQRKHELLPRPWLETWEFRQHNRYLKSCWYLAANIYVTLWQKIKCNLQPEWVPRTLGHWLLPTVVKRILRI